MPVLTPSLSPPISVPFTDGSNTKIPSGSGLKTTLTGVMAPSLESDEKSSDTPSTVSKLSLDVENISAEVAADLSSALVGHVLFLKNQVPFPVTQLYRIPNGKSTPKALKLRTDLLAAFDTLCSHLNTTFTALSTALALATGPGPRPPRRAYVAVLVGPSIGSAKTKVMFAVDGLATKVWGERDDVEEESSEEEEGATAKESVDEAETDDEDAGADDNRDEQSSESSDTDSLADSDDDPSSPPLSRSPSPSPRTSPSPVPCAPPPRQPVRTPIRLLAHTLATADHSMSDELGTALPDLSAAALELTPPLAPSQTHILLRAPRRFTHPAWIPRQTVSSALDNALLEFREEASDSPALTTGDRRKARTKAAKVEGVWVTCRNPGVEFSDDTGEDHEMIWWSWDGKIVGFADW
ncbi:hypothetical protein MSAN_01381100 [Mycena sanguinolenta]|uniref:Uncharacterized protein n=1 Tax=Mycena sanguinolenta TaxID=230812 RepID=A0A8H6Y930_9AGAR|nr:hypothetical protein MSAN_01381100 [Mycena sanguinolenta]